MILIDVERVENVINIAAEEYSESKEIMEYKDLLLDMIDVNPTIDPETLRPRGEWIYHDDGVVTCSDCGNAESSDSYYCRYCGAKMRIESEESK